MRARSLLLIVPLLWILGTTFTDATGHPWSSNRVTLNRLGEWIARFQKDQNRLPDNLSEVRTYAYSLNETPSLFDSFGQRLSYQPLTEDAFVLKSFGRDTTENTALITHDESYSRGLAHPAPGIHSQATAESSLNFYQSSFLEGLESPRGPLIASLKSRFRGEYRSRRLVIQNQTNPEFFMISFHDAIEEFLWLPGGYEIIFTAQGSYRYEDGLYYWNLTTNQVTNLAPKLREKFFPEMSEESKLYISLSHVSDSPSFLYIFAIPALDSGLMDPKDFYRYKNFFAINPREQFSIEHVAADKDFSIFDYPIDAKSLINEDSLASGTAAQKDWAGLPLSGAKQSLLEGWQAYCSNHANSPGLPYALWWLASLYNDTYRDLRTAQPEKARILRNYGLEITEALGSLSSAPSYLRAFAEHLKKNLLLSKPADYNVSSAGQEAE